MSRENAMESKTRDKTKASIRVWVVVQNRLLRETMVHLLQKKAGIAVVGNGASTTEFPELATTEAIDVLLLDSLTPELAEEMSRDLDEREQRPKAVFFGMDDDRECFLRAVQCGACGYLLKDASSEEIVSAVRRVADGEAICPPKLCMGLFEYVVRKKKAAKEHAEKNTAARSGLTYRQRQLMALVAQGMTNKEIASELNLSEFTVKNHIARVMRQLNADNRHEAAILVHADNAVGVLN
jgi:DNA-binding NarL/FixJ family response regulator